MTDDDPLDMAAMPPGASRAHIVSIRLRRLLDEDLKCLLADGGGLTVAEWRILSVLSSGGDAMSQKEIALASRIEQGQSSRALAAMRARGLLEATQSTMDRRAWNYALNDAGRALFERIIPQMRARQRTLDGVLTPQELALFEDMAIRVARQARPRDAR